MFFFFHKILLRLPPELAHYFAVTALKCYQRLLCLFKPKLSGHPAIHLKTLIELPFRSRVGLAAGFDKNAEAFVALSRLGFGFLEVGTVTPLPQVGNPKPRLWRVTPQGLINQMGFNNCGVEQFEKNIKNLRSRCQVPLFANIGKNKVTPNELAFKDYELLFTRLAPWVDGFVVNVSSPNTVGLRDLQSTDFLQKIEQISPQKPVFVKLAPDLDASSLKELFAMIKGSPKFSGCVLTNTSRQIALQEYQRTEGGYSGGKMFERTNEVVSLCREIFKEEKIIIAVGGINSADRARRIKAAGADLVEIYTGFVYQGPKLIHDLSKALAD